MLTPSTMPRIIHETSGLLFIDKPPGLISIGAKRRTTGLPLLREMQAAGDLPHEGKLFSVHRLDRVKWAADDREDRRRGARGRRRLRRREIDKYYVALSRKPNKSRAGSLETWPGVAEGSGNSCGVRSSLPKRPSFQSRSC